MYVLCIQNSFLIQGAFPLWTHDNGVQLVHFPPPVLCIQAHQVFHQDLLQASALPRGQWFPEDLTDFPASTRSESEWKNVVRTSQHSQGECQRTVSNVFVGLWVLQHACVYIYQIMTCLSGPKWSIKELRRSQGSFPVLRDMGLVASGCFWGTPSL